MQMNNAWNKWKWFPLKCERSRSQIFSINTPAYHHFVSKFTMDVALINYWTQKRIHSCHYHCHWQRYIVSLLMKCTCKSLWIIAGCLSSIKLHWSDTFVLCIIHLHYYCIIMRALFLCTTYYSFAQRMYFRYLKTISSHSEQGRLVW